jgi:hypothetical protein
MNHPLPFVLYYSTIGKIYKLANDSFVIFLKIALSFSINFYIIFTDIIVVNLITFFSLEGDLYF